MAYANSIVFYGWLEDDAVHTINHILGENKYKTSKCLIDNEKKIEQCLKKKINNDGIKLFINIFEGGLNSDEYKVCLYFNKYKECQSSSDDDIDDCSFSLDDIKEFMDMSFAMKNVTDHKCKPKLINLVVSDSK